ncbi:hypothetical protein B0H11DRAFT_1942079 [Mycena galericulata]|nr:hypothetical protein B0H11DRAFT_1942079 [Mycena galericulata]
MSMISDIPAVRFHAVPAPAHDASAVRSILQHWAGHPDHLVLCCFHAVHAPEPDAFAARRLVVSVAVWFRFRADPSPSPDAFVAQQIVHWHLAEQLQHREHWQTFAPPHDVVVRAVHSSVHWVPRAHYDPASAPPHDVFVRAARSSAHSKKFGDWCPEEFGDPEKRSEWSNGHKKNTPKAVVSTVPESGMLLDYVFSRVRQSAMSRDSRLGYGGDDDSVFPAGRADARGQHFVRPRAPDPAQSSLERRCLRCCHALYCQCLEERVAEVKTEESGIRATWQCVERF